MLAFLTAESPHLSCEVNPPPSIAPTPPPTAQLTVTKVNILGNNFLVVFTILLTREQATLMWLESHSNHNNYRREDLESFSTVNPQERYWYLLIWRSPTMSGRLPDLLSHSAFINNFPTLWIRLANPAEWVIIPITTYNVMGARLWK